MVKSRHVMLAALVALAGTSWAQCTDNNTVIAGGAITPVCPGTTNVPCVQGGQYALINVVNGNQYTFATCGASFDTQITLFNNAGGASLGFNDDSGTCGFFSFQSYIAWTATYTGQLRVLVDLYDCANNAVCAPLTITCASPPPPVTNADPCGSIPLALVATCGGGTYSNVGGGNSATTPAPTCGNFIGGSQDVWFTFVAGPLGNVSLQSTAGTLADGAMAVYSAPSCSGPFTQLGCDDDGGPGLMPLLNLSGLTPGTTYYVRFWGYGTNTGSFVLCAQGLTTLPAGDCVYTLNMYDSFGDGWGTSNVGVSTNGGATFTYYTVGGLFNQVVFGVNIGQIVVITYNNSGTFQGENSYQLVLGGSGLFSSGSPPANGVVYAQTVTCNPPPAPPEDCIGSITICSDQAINNNTNNTGNIADLTLTSAGCLGALERQGTWYNFTPSAGGTVAFTINPADPLDDYDFALWGPFPPGSTPGSICPPLAAPLRCSFAAPPGATGLDYTATDWSEPPAGDKWVQYITVTPGQVYLMYISNFSQSGLAFDLDWNLGSGASLDCTQLGAELLELSATAEVEDIRLDWSTSMEVASSHFFVERSTDGTHFGQIGQLPATGTSQVTTNYSFLDPHPANGMNYYRLQQVDLHGAVVPSKVVHAMGGTNEAAPLIRPNPVVDHTTVVMHALAPGAGMLEVTDGRGRTVIQRPITLQAGENRFDVDLQDLGPGVYLLRTSHGGNVQEPARLLKF